MEVDLGDVISHYESSREQDRLTGGLAELELVRTRQILSEYLPEPPTRILDVGGGTGVHAAWLLAEGYDVHLIDITPSHVERALGALGAQGLTAAVGDARRLAVPRASFDAALVLGPLYHLVERADRVAALTEARRVVRPGGVIAIAAISRFAPLFDGLVREFLFEPEFREIVERDLAEGRHANPHNRPHWFTTAFFHRPEQLREEIAAAGLAIDRLAGVEGLAGWLPHLEARWADEAARAIILEASRVIEQEPSLLGLSAHLLAVARGVDP